MNFLWVKTVFINPLGEGGEPAPIGTTVDGHHRSCPPGWRFWHRSAALGAGNVAIRHYGRRSAALGASDVAICHCRCIRRLRPHLRAGDVAIPNFIQDLLSA